MYRSKRPCSGLSHLLLLLVVVMARALLCEAFTSSPLRRFGWTTRTGVVVGSSTHLGMSHADEYGGYDGAVTEDDDDEEYVRNQQAREQLESVFKLNKKQQIPVDGVNDGVSEHHIPTQGISLSDMIDDAEVDKFKTTLVPVTAGVAQILTKSINYGAFDPKRFLVALSPPTEDNSNDNKNAADMDGDNDDDGLEDVVEGIDDDGEVAGFTSKSAASYVMVDTPPYSDKLASSILSFMGNDDSRVVAMVITSREGIHYDEGLTVYSSRRSDLVKWCERFPDMAVVTYRLDTPRDCREMVTQQLDGNGPWGWNGTSFVETGRPLTQALWDEDLFQRITEEGVQPPRKQWKDDQLYTPAAIRKREEGKQMLAIHTPGHTYGSMSFVFPETGVLASGCTIPIENFSDENRDFAHEIGPALDFRGYIGTSQDMPVQMKSARRLVETYCDRFCMVLASKQWLDRPLIVHDPQIRRELLLEVVDHYDRIGQIYDQLGISNRDDDDNNNNNNDNNNNDDKDYHSSGYAQP